MMPMRILLAAAVIVASTTAASSACVQADITGQWQVFSFNNLGEWASCNVVINSIGRGPDTTCKVLSNGVAATFPMTDGRFKLLNGSVCSFTGGFNLGGFPNVIRRAVMSRDKTIVNGVGSGPEGGASMFTMTKI